MSGNGTRKFLSKSTGVALGLPFFKTTPLSQFSVGCEGDLATQRPNGLRTISVGEITNDAPITNFAKVGGAIELTKATDKVFFTVWL